jgi:hypothetical protein
MPDPTTHFSWDVPTVTGDTGAWGTILNTLFDTADADLRANAGKPSEQLLIPASLGQGAPDWKPSNSTGSPEMAVVHTGSQFPLIIPLGERLRVGQRITGFTSRGYVTGTAAAGTVSLHYMDNTGVITTVSAGHSLPTAEAETTTSGLTHDVAANRAYFIKVNTSGAVSVSGGFLKYVKLTLEKSP